MTKPYAVQLKFVDENGEMVLYCEIKERRREPYKRIAKRYSGQNWISLEPGYVVRGTEPGTDYNRVSIEYDPTNTGPQ